MPIDYTIDHERRLVRALGRGVLSDEDVFAYQKEVWSRPDVKGYNELIDMRGVERIALPSVKRIKDLAKLSASMDTERYGARFAIVATSDFAYGLGRMYEMYRSLQSRGTKEVGVFRTLEEAQDFLGIKGPLL